MERYDPSAGAYGAAELQAAVIELAATSRLLPSAERRALYANLGELFLKQARKLGLDDHRARDWARDMAAAVEGLAGDAGYATLT